MLRILLLQQWYDLSDPATKDALIEMPTMRRFDPHSRLDSVPITIRRWHPMTTASLMLHLLLLDALLTCSSGERR
jgi:hypothetical protein